MAKKSTGTRRKTSRRISEAAAEAEGEDGAGRSRRAGSAAPSARRSAPAGLRASRSKGAPSPRQTRTPRAAIDFDSTIGREEAAAWLESIARGLRKGRIELHRDQRSLCLEPDEHVDFLVKAGQKGPVTRLRFEFMWRDESTGLEIVSGSAPTETDEEEDR